MNCNDCNWSRPVPGSAHIKCVHPSNKRVLDNSLVELWSIMSKRTGPIPIKSNKILNIKYNSHGWKNGWFNFPFNYDRIWLLSCDGFKEIDIEEVYHAKRQGGYRNTEGYD